MEIKYITISQLNRYIAYKFDSDSNLQEVYLKGEISNFKYSGKHCYFSLKDETAVLSCVYFDCNDENDFKNGDKVVVVGSPRYYVKGGKLNFNFSFNNKKL